MRTYLWRARTTIHRTEGGTHRRGQVFEATMQDPRRLDADLIGPARPEVPPAPPEVESMFDGQDP